ncbi:MAG: hypothetical protein QOK02_4195 [Mycobacterium sp.]|jgi:hypothetical protein|nr:hypothetical protein [Mycobacterium sp.]
MIQVSGCCVLLDYPRRPHLRTNGGGKTVALGVRKSDRK